MRCSVFISMATAGLLTPQIEATASDPSAVEVDNASSLSAANPSENSAVKGVNPAEVLNRADLIVKAINLSSGESIAVVAKYDQKLGEGLGANFELPFVSRVNVGSREATGIGDTFVRLRFVSPLGKRTIGLVAVETAAPTASNNLLGTGKWQLNPGFGVVQMWSKRSFTAALYKHYFSVAGSDVRADIDVNEIRALHSFVLDEGWYVTVDAKHEWQSKGVNQDWSTAEFEVGKQFNRKLASSVRFGRVFGDRRNNGMIQLNVRTFF